MDGSPLRAREGARDVAGMKDLHPVELRRLQVIAAGLLTGPLVLFAVGVLLRVTTGRSIGDLPEMMYVAGAVALASPMLAAAVRDRLLAADATAATPSIDRRRAAMIVQFGILEGAAFLCALAFLLTPTWWPLIAAAVPLGTMLAAFPRA